MRRAGLSLILTAIACAPVVLPAQQQGPGQASDQDNKNVVDGVKADQAGFVTIFDGSSMKGWRLSANSAHSRTSDNKSPGRWELRDGAIVGSQDLPGNGGLFMTDKKYSDFEVAVDMRNDFGVDSGLFLRTSEKGSAYQVIIDYRRGGGLAGVYGEGLGQPSFLAQPFSFLDAPDRIFTEGLDAPSRRFRNAAVVPMPVILRSWPTFWRHGQWNEIRARIVGTPAHITTWINGVQFLDWTDSVPRVSEGYIALQVHGGLEFVHGKDWVGVDGTTGGETDFTKRFVRYRNVRVKELKEEGRQAGSRTIRTVLPEARRTKPSERTAALSFPG
jgi:Domain of Unknown Function (DUF1080)